MNWSVGLLHLTTSIHNIPQSFVYKEIVNNICSSKLTTSIFITYEWLMKTTSNISSRIHHMNKYMGMSYYNPIHLLRSSYGTLIRFEQFLPTNWSSTATTLNNPMGSPDDRPVDFYHTETSLLFVCTSINFPK